MATTTQDTNRAKFLDLRARGKSVADARNATYWPPPVVADQKPSVATTPIAPTVNVQEQMAGKTVAERQAIRSGTPAPVKPTSAPEWTTTPSGATLNANWTIANAPLPTEQQINAQYGWVIQDNWINSVQPKVEQAPVKQPEPVKQVASAVIPK